MSKTKTSDDEKMSNKGRKSADRLSRIIKNKEGDWLVAVHEFEKERLWGVYGSEYACSKDYINYLLGYDPNSNHGYKILQAARARKDLSSMLSDKQRNNVELLYVLGKIKSSGDLILFWGKHKYFHKETLDLKKLEIRIMIWRIEKDLNQDHGIYPDDFLVQLSSFDATTRKIKTQKFLEFWHLTLGSTDLPTGENFNNFYNTVTIDEAIVYCRRLPVNHRLEFAQKFIDRFAISKQKIILESIQKRIEKKQENEIEE